MWRYNATTVQTTVSGVAGTYGIFATTGNNSFATNSTPPPPETDSTVYTFALAALVQGSTPGTAHYRKIGEAIFDGTRVLNLRQTIGADGARLAQPGDIKLSAAATPPVGWLRCDGLAVAAPPTRRCTRPWGDPAPRGGKVTGRPRSTCQTYRVACRSALISSKSSSAMSI